MTKKKIIIILSIIILVVIGASMALRYSGSGPGGEKSGADTEQDPGYYTSMEDGKEVTQSDRQQRQDMEDFASTTVVDYFKKEFPSSISLTPQYTEWYFTDHNTSDNILVTVKVISQNNTSEQHMRVVEVTRDSNKKLVAKNIYEPDERYR